MLEHRDLNEERANSAFRRVRNRLRKHAPLDIVLACIQKLNENSPDRVQHLRMYPPWRLLLLTKWAVIYGEYLSPDRKPLTQRDFNHLLNLMHDLEGQLKPPGEYTSVFLFFRIMAFQQFWLQHELHMASFARQSLLFARLSCNHPFQRRFLEKCGVSIADFIELSTMMMTRFTIQGETAITPEWFGGVAEEYEPGTIQRFLDALAIDFASLKDKLVRQQSSRRVQYEAYEKTPLKETPLLKHNGQYHPFSRELLARCLETFIYDTLRSDDPNSFMNRFGPMFERYVGNSISGSRIKHITEGELSRLLPGQGRVVDFLLVDDGNKAFVDAKGVEMSYLGMVGHMPKIITDKTRDSIIRGITQGFQTASRLEHTNTSVGAEMGQGKSYLIIVTFKDMFVGNGLDFYQYVAKDTLDGLIEEYGGTSPVPFEHMYFMSVDDFDLLLGGIASGHLRLTEALEHAVKCDATWETKKLTFGQHIIDLSPEIHPAQWLVAESTCILQRCRSRLQADA